MEEIKGKLKFDYSLAGWTDEYVNFWFCLLEKAGFEINEAEDDCMVYNIWGDKTLLELIKKIQSFIKNRDKEGGKRPLFFFRLRIVGHNAQYFCQ